MIDWETLKAEISQIPGASGREAAWLADKLGIGIQAVQNWSTRGVPPKQAPAIARHIKWSVARVMGADESTATWPLRRIARQVWGGLEEWERGAIEDAAVQKLRELEAERQIRKRTGT
jgi:hypothetical protein